VPEDFPRRASTTLEFCQKSRACNRFVTF
jgi:hypothetical protein